MPAKGWYFSAICVGLLLGSLHLQAKEDWSELNIGPFRVDYNHDESKARETLANLEQLRWILGGILETKELEATWPFRILMTDETAGSAPGLTFGHGEYIAIIRPGDAAPMVDIARTFIEQNTPRLPAAIDSNLPLLFEGLSAKGSRVTWASPPPHPTLGWARVQLLATKPAYAGRFRVFLNNLRGGAPLAVAETNAFGVESKQLEAEINAYFAAGNFQAITVSGRPLDPRKDFGEHALDGDLAALYLADTNLKMNRAAADRAYKAAAEAGNQALAEEGFALLVAAQGDDPGEYLENAIKAGSNSAWIYEQAAERQPEAEARKSLIKATTLNPRWWLPYAKLAALAKKPAEKESFLVEATKRNPRSSELWQSLAEVQSAEGKGMAAQNSWIRAADAAATSEERAQVEKKRKSLETQRLDAMDKAKRDAREAALADDQKAYDAQMARIHEAEAKANRQNSGDSEPETSDAVLPWFNQGEHPLEAVLVRVDCLNGEAKLFLRDTAGKTLNLFVQDPKHVPIDGASTTLGCGVQQPTRRVTVVYKGRHDRELGTVGDVTAIHFE
ncbi:MAG TPA: hypothetical protein VN633_14555 [Bryobacteraceae bacterium]|nr:hypothetical protein [Bryobacteraceae bacterium]